MPGESTMPPPHHLTENHIYYVTTNVYNRLPIFTRPSFILPLLDSLNYYRYQHQCKVLGYVIMPDHLHLMLFPIGESSLDEFMRDYKRFTAGRIVRQAKAEAMHKWVKAFEAAGNETKRGEHKVWQDSYWDKNIFSERFLRQKLNYIHRNPVRAKLVEKPEHYAYSSYRNYIANDNTLAEIDMGWTQ
jgi:REP element-mobilizing transposase RayT